MGGNLADRFEAAVDAASGADAVVTPEGRRTYAELDDRANRLAEVLAVHGVSRADRVGVLLHNGAEHLEVLLACFKLRAVPVNLNPRYLRVELADVLAAAGACAVVHEPDLAPLVPAELVAVETGADYELALDAAGPSRPDPAGGRSGDDHYLLMTGGTTGRPKGVLWRHEDLYAAALGAHEGFAGRRVLVAAPFWHGTGQWMALATLLAGGTVLTTTGASFDAGATWRLAADERATHLVLVGDAFAAPLADALEAHPGGWDLGRLTVLLSGGATLSPGVVARLLEQLPTLMVVDGYGASETGGHARCVWVAGAAPATASFRVDDDTAVLDHEYRPIPPGDRTVGWLARQGPLPLGYDGDEEATAETFPEVDGVRWAVPGDRARWAGPARIEILGRSSMTVNTGGEKVFVEEVEARLRAHPDVADAVVVGTPDQRWGEVVTAVIVPAGSTEPALDDLATFCRAALAPFKVPRRLVVVDAIHRTAAGKPDYGWAREQVGP